MAMVVRNLIPNNRFFMEISLEAENAKYTRKYVRKNKKKRRNENEQRISIYLKFFFSYYSTSASLVFPPILLSVHINTKDNNVVANIFMRP